MASEWEKLRELAGKAEGSGRWYTCKEQLRAFSRADSDFIIAADPSIILRLLEAREKLEREVEEARQLMQDGYLPAENAMEYERWEERQKAWLSRNPGGSDAR